MRIAFEGASQALSKGLSNNEAAQIRKPNVAFAGSMRRNLVSMLDQLNLQHYLGVESTAELFGSETLRTGSILKYPVFRNRQNYNGHTPKPLSHNALREMVDSVFIPELKKFGNCLILPLGKSVESILEYVQEQGLLNSSQVLSGFPHPSGANGHRQRQFSESRIELEQQINTWFKHNN